MVPGEQPHDPQSSAQPPSTPPQSSAQPTPAHQPPSVPPVSAPASSGQPSAGAPAASPPPPDPAHSANQPGGQGGQPAGSAQAGTAWYNGPLPIKGLVQRESAGAAIGRTAVKALTAVVVLSVGLFVIPLLLFATLAALGSAFSGGGGAANASSADFRTVVAGEANADVTLAMVPITGVILTEDTGSGGGLFAVTNQTFGYTVRDTLADLAEDDSVDGIILQVNSPGGTVTGSKAIADGVAAYQEETGKPVVAFVSGISASGGVYSMAGADEIYADHGTIIGSIGVIFGPFQQFDGVTAIDNGILGGGVTTENGITVEFLTAGRNKDFGNPFRPITDEERSVLQEGLDDAYDDFVAVVSEGRGLSESEIVDGMGANIFGELQAMNNGLIDGIADRDTTYQMAAEAAGLEDGQTWGVERVSSGPPSLFGSLASAGAERLSGDEPTASTVPTPLNCLGTGSILAYHGDPTLLCQNG